MTIEAMKQALEALVGYELVYGSDEKDREAITSLRQALSEAQLSVNENSHAIEQVEKREWVMLTDAEIEEFDYDVRDLVMDIEKLLMERNS